MNEVLIEQKEQSVLSHFKEVPNYFELIQEPLYEELEINQIKLINILNLVIGNCRKYYPLISEVLCQNDNCLDLCVNFNQITLITEYICEIIENNLKENKYIKTSLKLNYIEELLTIINKLLDNFHIILNHKISFLTNKITSECYEKEYDEYLLLLEDVESHFYSDIFKSDEKWEELSEQTKQIWSIQL